MGLHVSGQEAKQTLDGGAIAGEIGHFIANLRMLVAYCASTHFHPGGLGTKASRTIVFWAAKGCTSDKEGPPTSPIIIPYSLGGS